MGSHMCAAFCDSVSLCDGPDDDHLIGRNMLSIWHFYGKKRTLLCWRIIFYVYHCLLKLDTKWRIVSFNFRTLHHQKNSPGHILNRRLVSPQIRYRCFGENIYKLLLLGIELRILKIPAHIVVFTKGNCAWPADTREYRATLTASICLLFL